MTRLVKWGQRLAADRNGAVALVFALLFPLFVGILVLGIETGIWLDVKRHNQAIADIAAYSGALQLAAATGTGCTSGTGAAVATTCPSVATDASTNGFDFSDSANTTSSVVVSNPTVTVTLKHQQTPLMVKYFLADDTFPIIVQSVASVQSQSSCASSTGSGGVGISMNGNPTLNMPGCTITSDSTASDSIKLTGGATIDAWTVYTAGGISDRGSSSLNLNVPESTHAALLKDPYCKSSLNCLQVDSAVTGFSAMPTLPSTAAPTTWANPTTAAPTRDNSNYPPAPSSSTNCTSGNTDSTSGNKSNMNKNCYTSPLGVNLTGSGNQLDFSGTTPYYFAGPVTISGSATIESGVSIVANGNFTVTGSLTVCPNGDKNSGTKAGATILVGGAFDASSASNVVWNQSTGCKSISTTNPSGYSLQAASGIKFGNATFDSGAQGGLYSFSGSGLTIANGSGKTTYMGPASYQISTGGLTIGAGTGRFTVNSPVINGVASNTGYLTINSGGISNSNSGALWFNSSGSAVGGGPVNYFVSAPAYTMSSGSTIFGGNTNVGLYGGGLTLSSGANLTINSGENFYLDSGALALNGCTAIGGTTSGSAAGTSTIMVNSGSVTTASGSGGLTFAPSGAKCGTTFTGADSTYKIKTTGSNGIALSGSATFNAGTYYFLNSSTSGTGLAINGNTSTFANGIYSIQNGNFSVASGATANFNAGTGCTPTSVSTTAGSCLYIANGGFSNAGTTSFATGTYYLYTPYGTAASFTNSGTLTLGTTGSNKFYIDNWDNTVSSNKGGAFVNSGTLNFGAGTYHVWNGQSASGSNQGGFSSSGTLTFTGGNGSTYEFFNGPAFGTSNSQSCGGGSSGAYGALSIQAGSTANFGPANYYAVNGALCINQSSGTAPTLTCTGCSTGGAGVTFILTGSTVPNGAGTYPAGVSTLQVPGLVTSNLNAPDGTPDGDHTTCRAWSSSTDASPNPTGCYAGILFLQDPDYQPPVRTSPPALTAQTPDVGNFNGNSCPNNNNCSFLDGGDNMELIGAVYIPESVVDFKSNNTASTCVIVIAESIIFSGNSTLNASQCATFGVATVTSTGVALTQ